MIGASSVLAVKTSVLNIKQRFSDDDDKNDTYAGVFPFEIFAKIVPMNGLFP